MEFDRYYVVFLKKGPTWAPDSSPELEALQESHLSHIRSMAEEGKLALAGPTEAHTDPALRGISIFYYDAFESLDDLRTLVEQDPAFQVGRLVYEYQTWCIPKGTPLGRRFYL